MFKTAIFPSCVLSSLNRFGMFIFRGGHFQTEQTAAEAKMFSLKYTVLSAFHLKPM
uniref:Uncharacterized protein n=1 Tax=Anguilla anguilla TaxID=7936 RepID=A0A0E9VPF1_ANGAN